MTALAGAAILALGIALLWAFRPAPSQAVVHHEWVEISVAMVVTAAIALGLMLVIGDIGGLLLSLV